MFKCIIAGSRTFCDYTLLQNRADYYLQRHLPDVVIVSGTAAGADVLGERYANEQGLDVLRMPADWTQYGKRAGYLRNVKMSTIADAALIFWDGKSKGTKHMIQICRNCSLPYRVVDF